MQISYGLYWRFLLDLVYLNQPVENTFLVVLFTQKMSFLTKRKVVKEY